MSALLASLLLSALPPELALLCTDAAEGVTELRLQRAGDGGLAPPVARLRHAPGTRVRGALLPGTRVVLAAAVIEHQRDQSFASSLLRLEPGQPPQRLVGDLPAGTGPLVTRAGRVFVSRGNAWAPSRGGERLDALRIDEVDPRTGEARALLSVTGLQLLLVGSAGAELLVFELGTDGARLLALHPDTGATRVQKRPFSPLARDFVVDEVGGRLLYTTSEPGARAWYVEALDLRSGAVRSLAEGATMALLPTLFPDGRVGYAPHAGGGLREVGTDALLLPPQGPGFERLRFFAGDVVVGLHEVPGRRPTPVVVERRQGIRPAVERLLVEVPSGASVEVVGLVP